MVLKPQTVRNWKLFTGVACAATVFHTIFRVDYGPQEHCFTGAQRWYNDKMDTLLGIGPSSPSESDAFVQRQAGSNGDKEGGSGATSTNGGRESAVRR